MGTSKYVGMGPIPRRVAIRMSAGTPTSSYPSIRRRPPAIRALFLLHTGILLHGLRADGGRYLGAVARLYVGAGCRHRAPGLTAYQRTYHQREQCKSQYVSLHVAFVLLAIWRLITVLSLR